MLWRIERALCRSPTARPHGLNRDGCDKMVAVIAGMVMVTLIVKGGGGGRDHGVIDWGLGKRRPEGGEAWA